MKMEKFMELKAHVNHADLQQSIATIEVKSKILVITSEFKPDIAPNLPLSSWKAKPEPCG